MYKHWHINLWEHKDIYNINFSDTENRSWKVDWILLKKLTKKYINDIFQIKYLSIKCFRGKKSQMLTLQNCFCHLQWFRKIHLNFYIWTFMCLFISCITHIKSDSVVRDTGVNQQYLRYYNCCSFFFFFFLLLLMRSGILTLLFSGCRFE